MGATVAIRVGGPNSGHTVIGQDGRPIIFKHLPTAALLPKVLCVLPAGSYIRPDILSEEIRIAGLEPGRLLIDPNAVVITDEEVSEERESSLRCLIGSTQSGTGAAVIRRTARVGGVRLARDDKALSPYVHPTSQFLRSKLDKRERVLIEGTQGFGLSVLHSPHYPFATSRDTTAAGFVAEAGLSPLDVDDVVLVIRAFPIRVPGNSGPLPNEISWQILTRESRHAKPIEEYTSVTRGLRRVARFDSDIVRQAIRINRPSRIVLNHLDYLDPQWPVFDESVSVTRFIESVEVSIHQRVHYAGGGPQHVQLLGSQLRLYRPVN
jgi:adenylosuccinate synthase